MKELLFIPIITLTIYLLYVYFKYGMTKSISATFQKLGRNEKLLFIFTLWSIAFPVMIVGILNAPTALNRVLFGIAGGFVLLISVAPMYWRSRTLNNRQQAIMHYVGSYGGIGVGMIACLLSFCTLSVILIISTYFLFVMSQMLLKWKINNYIYWIEVVALIVISTILYLNQQLVL